MADHLHELDHLSSENTGECVAYNECRCWLDISPVLFSYWGSLELESLP